jgi:hypothetical protein
VTKKKALDIHSSKQWAGWLTISSHGLIHHFRRRELVPNIKAAVNPFHWPQFIDSNEDFSKNTIQEALDRESHSNKDVVRDIQSYMVTRRETIGTRPCFVLMRSTRRLYIPDDILENPIIREMENVALDMVYIVNVREKQSQSSSPPPLNCLAFLPGRLFFQEGIRR